MEQLEIPKWLIRNPLGIIALFISLIYGMSALLLGTSIEKLTESNQTILVIFVVAFPVLVLGVFAWLVISDHNKLYGPGDFRTDESFLQAAEKAPRLSLGHRIEAETEIVAGDDIAVPITGVEARGAVGNLEIEAGCSPGELRKGREEEKLAPVATAYLLEGLVLDELERQLGGPAQRQALFRGEGKTFEMDGVIETSDHIYAVEIKLLKGEFARRLREMRRLVQHFEQFITGSARSWRLIVALVSDKDTLSHASTAIENFKNEIPSFASVQLFDRHVLLKKYGFDVGAD